MSSVMIYFDSYMMTALRREELYTLTDFLAGMFDSGIVMNRFEF